MEALEQEIQRCMDRRRWPTALKAGAAIAAGLRPDKGKGPLGSSKDETLAELSGWRERHQRELARRAGQSRFVFFLH